MDETAAGVFVVTEENLTELYELISGTGRWQRVAWFIGTGIHTYTDDPRRLHQACEILAERGLIEGKRFDDRHWYWRPTGVDIPPPVRQDNG